MAEQSAVITIQNHSLIWKSPDGKKQLFTIEDSDGVVYKTWSQKLVETEGSVTVNTYEKDGRDGPELFASLPKEGYGNGGYSKGGYSKGASNKGGNRSFALSYAKDLMIAQGPQDNPVEAAHEVCRVADIFIDWLDQ
jgi:hypothetical protein